MTTNFARVEASELPALLKRIDNYDASHFARLALKLMVHVLLRTN
jgi:hypothetical protein